MRRRSFRLTHEQRVLLLAVLAGLPGVALSFVLMAWGGYSARVQWTLGLGLVFFLWATVMALSSTVVRPLQTLSNLLAALREEDFSFRARGTRADDPLGLVMREVNALAQTLREQRLGALEASALLRKVMEEIDVAVFAFDAERRLQLVNRAGERTLGRPVERLLGRTADELGLGTALDTTLDASTRRVLELAVPNGPFKFEVSGSAFRQHGRPHRLLVLANVSLALREEERLAWQRLIRVLGHELNNSLAPIKSIAGSLGQLLDRPSRPPDWQDDAQRGLAVIGARAESLSRFMEAYGRLARLPPPERQPVSIPTLLHRVAGLETRVPVAVAVGPEVTLRADSAQLEQLLINLLRNAAEASLETGGRVAIEWELKAGQVVISVNDDGPGVSSTANLFVPFFTTKPQGSGIGLVLSRQIAEAHGGSLTLQSRVPGPGCRAEIRLPLQP